VTGCEIGFIGYEYEISDDVRPLPRGEGEPYYDAGNFSISIAVTDSVSFTNQTHDNLHITLLKTRQMILPLPGERVRVRAGVNLIP
jgi:hypothetical protein